MPLRKKKEKTYKSKDVIEILKRIESLVSSNDYTLKEISEGLIQIIQHIEKKD